MRNQELARLFEEIGLMSEFLGDNPFRVRAYYQAARTLYDLDTPIEEVAKGGREALLALPGIGPDLAEKILEFIKTGEIRKHRELAERVPKGVLAVMEVPGVGPKTARQLYDELGIDSLEKLREALDRGDLLRLKGFGQKKAERIREGLALVQVAGKRRPLGAVLSLARNLLAAIRDLPGVERAELCGSARRYKDTVGDLDYLVASERSEEVVKAFVKLPQVKEVYAQGKERATVFLKNGLQVDLRVVPPESWGSGLQYLTGSKEHSIRLRGLAQERGLKLSEYGVFRGERRLAGETEERVYEALGLPFIPPPLREDHGEIEAALEGRLPTLLELSQVKGDLQVHSTYSDGQNSLEELWEAARALGYGYLGVTDHSPAVRVAGGPSPEEALKRIEAIRRFNEGHGPPYLLAGAEVDIRPDGSLDYPDWVLRELDLVLISIHSSFKLSKAEQTKRILRALENPFVHVLAHPTARLIGRRPPIEADWEAIFRKAKERGVAVEIDGYYDRMDLPDDLARMAYGMGLWISLSTDAHQVEHLRFMELAVGTAQRAWIGPERVLNTLSYQDLMAWLRARRGP
ncbi:DNA polymerase/3'-5' exonuclease PolX [Thermus tengchongensis]|uniref:DNA polymerase beta n=1 Tax=Thermus tengchongensis TaxID=1214928 RepID=A0A4Y9FAY6_9DEIN|nr:DNA polymerase/3'-5' exonuclease PolX [Thermus tengchongensis]TFU25992.1 DNA polymerase/3'-5' exonuclease PolX [Thermus tengchongensis]